MLVENNSYLDWIIRPLTPSPIVFYNQYSFFHSHFDHTSHSSPQILIVSNIDSIPFPLRLVELKLHLLSSHWYWLLLHCRYPLRLLELTLTSSSSVTSPIFLLYSLVSTQLLTYCITIVIDFGNSLNSWLVTRHSLLFALHSLLITLHSLVQSLRT